MKETGRKRLREQLVILGAIDHDLRLKAMVEINANPGIYVSDLAKKMRIGKGILGYHLGVLHAAQLISYEQLREHTCCYFTPKGTSVYHNIIEKLI